MTNLLHTIKKYFFPVALIIVYIILMVTVFFGGGKISDVGATIGLQIILLIFLFLSVQSAHRLYAKRILRIIAGIGLILSLVARGTYNFSYTIFILCTHAVVLVYLWERGHLAHSSRLYYFWRASHRGLSTSALLLALTYTATLRATGTDIAIDCADLRNQTIGLVTRYIPSLENSSSLLSLAQRIDILGSQTFGQVLGASSLSGEFVGGSEGGNSGLNYLGDILSGDLQSSGMIYSTGNIAFQTGLLSSLLGYQRNLIDGIMNNQELIDAKVCDLTLDHIQDVIHNSQIKIIGFILLVILLSLFMRSVMFVIGIVNFILIRILAMIGIFSLKTSQSESEWIE